MKKSLILIIFLLPAAAAFSQTDEARWSPKTAVVYDQYNILPQVYNPPQKTSTRVYHNASEIILANPNVLVLPSPGVSQSELYLAANRQNPLQMFGSSNAVAGATINSGSYITIDGGTTWLGTNTINSGNPNNQRGDPGPTIRGDGRVIFTHLTSTVNFQGVTGMGAEYSTDNGITFSTTFQVVTDANADKNLAGTDDVPSSPYYLNCYMAWTSFSNNNGRFSRTTDGGVTWSTPLQLNTVPSGHFSQGHDLTVRPNGGVVVVWTAGVLSSPFTEDFVGVARSTNGGLNFTATENAYDVNGSRSTAFNGWGIRTNGFPRIATDKTTGPRSGWVYVVTDERNLSPAGTDADVVLHRSTDGGVTWSAGIRVNQDVLNNGKVQFFPCVAVDPAGGVNVVYYDNRNFPSSGDSCSVFVSHSTDGGNTWADVELADHHFRPKPVPLLSGGYMGDYIGIASGSDRIWGFWMDDKTPSGDFQAWAGWISIIPTGIGEENSAPSEFYLYQNYPNPFNSSTNIRFKIPSSPLYEKGARGVRLLIYDVRGKQIASFNPAAAETGQGLLQFDASKLPGGVYFYRLVVDSFGEAGKFSRTRKMILLK